MSPFRVMCRFIQRIRRVGDILFALFAGVTGEPSRRVPLFLPRHPPA